MRLDRLGLIRQRQSGLTLVELMIAIALAGIVTAGITMLISNVFATSARTSNHMTAVRQVQSAGYWGSKDALQAQNVTPDGGDSGFPLTLTWEWEGTKNEVTYTITADNKLQRSLKITPNAEEPTTQVSIIAQYIDPAETSFLPRDSAFIFRVTATVGGQSETRVYEVEPRPDP